ncbi:MAG: UvrD-helicase domain-containing protein [Muricomes sp.]
MLYRFRKNLKSENIMILSPNKVFANYISNVLPELGEENIPEIGFEDLAHVLLGNKIKFQSFSEQVEELLAADSSQLREQIKYKSTNDFVESLEKYLTYSEESHFIPRDLEIGDFRLSKNTIQKRFAALKNLPVKARLNKIASDIIEKDKGSAKRLLKGNASRILKKEISSMFLFSDIVSLYKNYYSYSGLEEYYTPAGKRYLNYSDVFPLIYVKMFFEGVPENYKHVKHLLIDEMQDYAPVQYAVLSKLFSCKMTILGDLNQSVNPYSSSAADKIVSYFSGSSCVELQKSYRSTYEIMEAGSNSKKE